MKSQRGVLQTSNCHVFYTDISVNPKSDSRSKQAADRPSEEQRNMRSSTKCKSGLEAAAEAEAEREQRTRDTSQEGQIRERSEEYC